MRRLIVAPLAFLMLIVALPLAAQTAQEGKLTIAAYNIENAFDVFDDPYTEDEGTAVKQRWQLEAIAKSIAAIDADIVLVSEVENEAILRSIVTMFLADRGYQHIAVTRGNDGRGINLGIISRLPIDSITSYRWQTLRLPGETRTWRFARDLFHAKVELPDGRLLHAFCVHYKSKRSMPGDEESVSWRTAEALRTREIIDKVLADDPEALVVLGGDLNSNPGEPPMKVILGEDAEGNPSPLTDLHKDIPAAERITLPSTRYPNTIIDYIITSPAMTKRYIPGSAGLITDAELVKGSDHYPVYASFDLTK